MQKNNLNKIKMFTPSRLRGVAERHKALFFDRVTEKGLDYKGRPFPKYSKAYLKLLGKDYRKESGERYKGFENLPLSTSGQKIGKRQFNLRGLTMANFRVRKVNSDGYYLGWDGEPAAIVEGNAKKGRDIINDIPDSEKEFVVKELGLLVDKEFDKIPGVINISVGS